MRLAKAKIRLRDGSKLTALLNTDIEINVIIRELMEDTNLAMRQRPKLKLISYKGHSWLFLGLCKDIEIAIRRLKISYPIFVIETRNYDLVLGQLFLNSVKFCQEYKPDRIFGTITQSYIHQIAFFRTLAPQDPANLKENQIFF